MRNTPKRRPTGLCRRSFLRNFIFGAFGLSALAMTARRNAAAAAERKATQDSVDYRAAAQGASVCSNCKYFQSPSSCLIVEGAIAPGGWCNKYAR